MNAKALLAVAAMSTCNGPATAPPPVTLVDVCSVTPDPGSAYAEAVYISGEMLEVDFFYQGCEDAELTICWDGAFGAVGSDVLVAEVEVDMKDPNGDDCWGHYSLRTFRYDLSLLAEDARAENPDAHTLMVSVHGLRDDVGL